MNLTAEQKSLCIRVVNVFETGTPDGDYSNVTIMHDGPHDILQITYGRSQTTEYGNLAELVERYVNAAGTYSAALKPFVTLIGNTPLTNDNNFISLLRAAGKEDPVMKGVQDEFFEIRYYSRALAWADEMGFKEALSMLVIYDSFIHSNGILNLLRARFPEKPPANGGNERNWISQYVDIRRYWLANNDKVILHSTVYRMDCFKNEMARNNWDLSQEPIIANGIAVKHVVNTAAVNLPPLDSMSSPKVLNLMTTQPLPGIQSNVSAPSPVSSISFVATVISLAYQQWHYFGEQRYDTKGVTIHPGHKEGEDGWWQRVAVFWECVGRDDLDGRDHDWPWSAAFISWLMKQAGAGNQFTYSASHATYISKSIRDRNLGNQQSLYWGVRLTEAKPKPGDLVCWTRDKDKSVDYDHQYNGEYSSHTDLVVEVRSNEIDIIGGNVGNSVTLRTLSLDQNGFLPAIEQAGEKLFALMQCRKP